MEVNTNKPLEEKNIVEKFTNGETNQFKVGSAMIHMENRIKELEEAMMFFSDWYNKTQKSNIILPDNLDEKGNTKIILE